MSGTVRELEFHRMRVPPSPTPAGMSTEMSVLDRLCRVYAFEHQILPNGSIRIMRFKGEQIILDKIFKSYSDLLKVYPLERVR